MGNTAIRAIGISKEYTINHSYTNSFKELMARIVFHARKPDSEKTKTIKILDQISFDVQRGESLGIIGKNGAGKSTLLKILSGITKPTSGQVEIFGRMNSILDIGVGFHPELTGRENIFLSGELNGLNRREISKRLDEIIDFSGVEQFIDTPVKYYSSGMFLRLAFSVFTGIDSDILLLDEVMSVGDAEFQIKSAKKLQSMFSQGKTILLVSHNPADIVKLCNRVIVLEGGKIREEGAPGKVVVDYMEDSIISAMEAPEQEKETDAITAEGIPEPQLQEQAKLRNVVQWDDLNTAPGNEFFRLLKVEIRAEGKLPDEPMFIHENLIIEINYWKDKECGHIDTGLFLNHFGNTVFASNTILDENKLLPRDDYGFLYAKTIIPGNLLNNNLYSIDIHFVKDYKELILNVPNAIYFKLIQLEDPRLEPLKKYFKDFPGYTRPLLEWMVNHKIQN